MMSAGGNVRPEKAAKTGLVNELAEPAALERTALLAARELAEGTLKPTPKRRSWLAWALEGNPLGRALLFDQARKRINAATGGKYAAPLAIVDTVATSVGAGAGAGAAAEAAAFGQLGMTDTSRALRGLFFSDTATRKHLTGFTAASAAGAGRVATLGIVGAGLMGAGIAQVSAVAGLRVVLNDRAAGPVGRGEKQVGEGLAALVKRRRLTPFEASRAASLVHGVSEEGEGAAVIAKHLARCDGVIEAVFEDLGVKHAVIAALERVLPPTALIATNTSAIPIASIAAKAAHPERVCGLHYFSPVDKMPLAEVIPHAGTSPAAIGAAIGLAQKQGKTVILVRDVPGFYVNRCLGPYMTEGMALCVGGGVEPGALDAALKDFGFPVGPVTLMDEVGVDVAFHTFSTLRGALGDRMDGGSPGALEAMLAGKQLGRKSGAGFFLYPAEPKGKKAGKGPRAVNPAAQAILARHRAELGAGGSGGSSSSRGPVSVQDMQQRMLLRFIKESILCAQDDILAPGCRESNPKMAYATGDIGAVFGIGFPPFLVRGVCVRGARVAQPPHPPPCGSLSPPPSPLTRCCRAGPSATATWWGRARWLMQCSATPTRWAATLRPRSSSWTWQRQARHFTDSLPVLSNLELKNA
jgi:enoyl-CoA hydratase/long-chain 3-hydroxyacyl-CoA dehydrogenase